MLSTCASAQEPLPRLELGASLFALNAPDYRGSESDDTYLFPIPYIKYRGERLRVDDGALGLFLNNPDLEITLSGNATVPVDGDTPEREGMEDLEPIFEIGPSLDYRFYRMEKSSWWVNLPLRFTYTIDSQFEHVGRVFQPRLEWRKPSRWLGDWKLGFNIGPVFASEEYHDYFYSVAASEATTDRPAYDADAGFSGIRTEFSYSKRIGKYWLGGFLRYDNLNNSEIEDSPLVLETESWLVGIALGWVFHER